MEWMNLTWHHVEEYDQPADQRVKMADLIWGHGTGRLRWNVSNMPT
jgi:hypothetical protein